MTIHSMQKTPRGRASAVSTLVLLLALGACNTTQVEIPELSGPSELALSLNMTASPDVLVADGASTSAIQATIRDANGRPVPGQAVFFAVTDANGNSADIGELNTPNAVSGPSGTAQVIYRAPARTDATANQMMRVEARPISTDALDSSTEPSISSCAPRRDGCSRRSMETPTPLVASPYRRHSAS